MTYQSDPSGFALAPALAAMRLPGGLLTGTSVLTAAGPTPVERIGTGTRVVTRSGLVPVIGTLSAPAHRNPLVRIEAGSGLMSQARRDLVVAAGQFLYLRGRTAFSHTGRQEAMVTAGSLADGIAILRCVLPDAEELRLHRLVFAEPEIIFAEGCELGCAALQVRRPVFA
ncbi:MAG: Hint domain-containing protein [Rhodobacteraceae bacterium]|nr:Hint domain-containing protein [Paracoccaceae bacterium]